MALSALCFGGLVFLQQLTMLLGSSALLPTTVAHKYAATPRGIDAKIALSATSVIDGWCAPNSGGFESNVPYNLCDEQELAGDPAAGRGGTPQTFWSPGFTSWYYPEVFAVIDLGRVHDVTQVFAWHRFGGVHMELSFATDRLLHPSFSLEVSTTKSPSVPQPTKYWEQSWAGFNVTAVARFVSIRLYSETNLYEVIV